MDMETLPHTSTMSVGEIQSLEASGLCWAAQILNNYDFVKIIFRKNLMAKSQKKMLRFVFTWTPKMRLMRCVQKKIANFSG